MSRDIGLIELAKHGLLSYPLPDQQNGEKLAAFTCLHSHAQNPYRAQRGFAAMVEGQKLRLGGLWLTTGFAQSERFQQQTKRRCSQTQSRVQTQSTTPRR